MANPKTVVEKWVSLFSCLFIGFKDVRGISLAKYSFCTLFRPKVLGDDDISLLHKQIYKNAGKRELKIYAIFLLVMYCTDAFSK